MVGFPGDFSVYIEDEKGNRVEIDADQIWETASCIKVAVLMELFRLVSLGEISSSAKLTYTPENYTLGSGIMRYLTPGMELTLKDLATLMIIVSDNVATNILIDFLGRENINSTCKKLGLENTRLKNKIYFEANKPATIGETTAKEYIMLFKLIREEVFGPVATEEMEDILKNQRLNLMLTRFLPINMLQAKNPGEKPELEIGTKSGSLENCRNDGGIIYTPLGDFFIAVFTKNFSDPYYHNDHVANYWAPRISNIAFHHFLGKGGSFQEGSLND